MVSVARNVRLASRLATVPRVSVKAAIPSVAQRAAFSVSARQHKSEVIKETEVPVSVYNPDGKGAASSSSDHFSIPVKRTPEPVAEEDEKVSPLEERVYRQMPKTMQRMSVMGKVIIITG